MNVKSVRLVEEIGISKTKIIFSICFTDVRILQTDWNAVFRKRSVGPILLACPTILDECVKNSIIPEAGY